MSQYAVIQANEITNVLEWDGEAEFSPPEGTTLTLLSSLPSGIGPGFTLSGSVWSAPPVPVPQTVNLWQAKAQLQIAGLLTTANTAIASLNNDAINSFWSNATTIDRSSPTLAMLAGVLGLSSAQVDQLFIAASAISL